MTEFLQLTEFVNEEEKAHASSTTVSDSLRNRPGPTPATFKPVYHNTATDEADECIDEETTAPALDERAPTGGQGEAAIGAGAKSSRPQPSEASNTVWIGR